MPNAMTVAMSGTVDDPSQAVLGTARRGWLATITVNIPEGDSALGAMATLDTALQRAGVPLVHGTRWKIRRRRGSR